MEHAEPNPEPGQPAQTPRCVVVFGGTFDPPHAAHTDLPTLVLEALSADEVCYVPAGRSPFKLDHEQSAPQHRLAMLQRALEGMDHVRIDTGEVLTGDDEPSYTIDTVRRLQDERGTHTKLRLLIGTDQLFSFAKWCEAEALAALAPLAVLVRPPHSVEQTRWWLTEHAPDYLKNTSLIEAPAMDVSSSMIRQAVRNERDISPWVSPAVEQYIRGHGLYRNV